MTTSAPELRLELLPDEYAMSRLDAGSAIPEWALKGPLWSVTSTVEELSIVCLARQVPPNTRRSSDWRAFRVAGQLDFSVTGILLAIATPLAQAKISIFAVSTFDTDYVLVPLAQLENAAAALRAAGHEVQA